MPDPVPQGIESLTKTTPLHHPSSQNVDEGRFLPGTVLAQRYRIINLLGRGGMGEVYRATDLLLGQAVALKFLPASTAHDEAMLVRFRNEVRIARQVSHPNVCRVYDIGEVDGVVFLSMEFVDGEDLASLLRRIGHLPNDKALEIVRMLCAGLAAAHDKGVIHRDLKPANIMLDGQGQVRVMDFGLAAFAEQARDIRSGTPGYLAPEQKAGREVTTKSDIYALGIVVHEIYTGKRPSERISTKAELDPEVATAIERCLAEDPRKRPASALAVVAALPGGDPLAAALVAGETPSPEVVANAGPAEGIGVGRAAACLVLLLLLLSAGLFLSPRRIMMDMIPTPESPEVLAGRARDYIRSFGYTSPPTHTAMGWDLNTRLIGRLWDETSRTDRAAVLKTLQPPAVTFWYRQHPRMMYPLGQLGITRTDPSFDPGSLEVILDPLGRLVEFHASPEEHKTYQPGPPPDWSSLFKAAGLDVSRFQPTQPQFAPRRAYDSRQAWKGEYPASPNTQVHVEAAAYEGKVSSFRVVVLGYESPAPPAGRKAPAFVLFFMVIVPLLAAVAAWRNLVKGRADLKGAFRLGLFCFGINVLRGLLSSYFTASLAGPVIWKVLSEASFSMVVMGVLYMALEPYVRRRMPQALISWTRILEGRWRDPRAGGDILTGMATYAAFVAIMVALSIVLSVSGAQQSMPTLPEVPVSSGAWLAGTLWFVSYSIGGGLSFLALLAMARFLLKRTWLAACILTVLLTAGYLGGAIDSRLAGYAGYFALVFTLQARQGLLSATVFIFTNEILSKTVQTIDFSRWYAWQGICASLVVVVIGVFAFWTNLGGRSPWSEQD